jgi:hypothetical protein
MIFSDIEKTFLCKNQWNMRHVTHHNIAIDIILATNIASNKTWFEAQK